MKPDEKDSDRPCDFCNEAASLLNGKAVFATKDMNHAICSDCIKALFSRVATLVTLDILDERRMTRH
jgi:hypothetical protein